ncbi:MAG: SUMF1/EgtB/PvdO family nonheme iron enzyme [Prevotella sp.]|nr:SUMF1/EgtB/PvdO family nonheme iron enzyme [Prevotella sp.]
MKKIRTALFILITGLSVSCMKEEIPSELESLSVTYHMLEVPFVDIILGSNTNLSQSITINAENTDWEISGLPEWLSVYPLSGSGNANITLTAKKNTTTSNLRKAEFKICSRSSGFSRSITIFVSQEGFVNSFTVNGVSFNMIGIEGGTFMFGYDNSVQVKLTKNYFLGETEVTQELWQAVMGSLPSINAIYGVGAKYPIGNIKVGEMLSFIEKLCQITGKHFRLPTAAEWEFAARGGNYSKGYTYSGSNAINEVAWYNDNSYAKGTGSSDYGAHVVKAKSPNELGIYDMSGNVEEVCADDFFLFEGESGPTNFLIDPIGETLASDSTFIITRGGNWTSPESFCRVYSSKWDVPKVYVNRGFRLAMSE